MCLCGKKKGALNDTNWIRHKTTCKVIKLNSSCANKSISSYFKRSSSTEISKKKNISVVIGLSDAVQNVTSTLPLTTIHDISYNDTADTATAEHEGFLENINVVDTVVNPENPLEIYDTDKIDFNKNNEDDKKDDNDFAIINTKDPAKIKMLKSDIDINIDSVIDIFSKNSSFLLNSLIY